MKKLLPVVIFFLCILFFFRAVFLQRFLPIPADDLVGLYNPFRDFFAQEFPRGVPFKNFLITDPIRQQYPWRFLAVSLEKNMQLPLWNPYSFSGYPLLANFQSAVFYPFNIFFFVMPFPLAWTFLILLQPLLAGLFLYWYLRSLRLQRTASILGSIAFAFSGFSVAWLEWGILMQTFLWVPLVFLAADKLLQKWNTKWAIIFFFAQAAMIFAGHIQILFYGLCMIYAYLFLRFWQKAKQQNGNIIKNYLCVCFPFFLVGIVIFTVTAVQWLPTLQLILHSARSVDQNYLTTPGWFIPWQNLAQFLAPDFFGNPTTLNYWGVWNYGEFIGYIGLVPLFFALFALIARRDKKTYFFGTICLLGFLFALPTPLAKIPFLLRIPFLSTSQPTRLISVIDVSLAILTALGLDAFLKQKTKISAGFVMGILTIGFVLLWLIVLKFPFGITPANLVIAKHNLFFPTIIFACMSIVLLPFIFTKKYMSQKIQLVLLSLLLFIAIFDSLRFADKFTPFTSQNYIYPQTTTISFLQKNMGDYRFMTTDSQILAPNISDVYHLQSIEGYDPLYLQNYGEFIAAMQRNKPDISSPFGFNRIITPHTFESPFINLLGVKYVLSLTPITNKNFQKVFQEEQTLVYQNKKVLPRTFFVDRIISANAAQDAITMLFANQTNLSHIAIVQQGKNLQVAKGSAQIVSYLANKVIIQTTNAHAGFLVLTDIYYPTWHAYVDNKETAIYVTDFTFRGIFVPSGKHTIVFQDKLF